ncbi:MAG: hypothetical protein ACE14W_01435 [Candidatus Velamenicoccus archaeovorus]
MTERPVRRSRLSKRALRTVAWISGGVAFLSPWAVLGVSPKPAAQAASPRPKRPVVIVRKVTRRVVVQDTATPAPVRYVVSGPSGGAAPAAAPVTSTSGSVP